MNNQPKSFTEVHLTQISSAGIKHEEDTTPRRCGFCCPHSSLFCEAFPMRNWWRCVTRRIGQWLTQPQTMLHHTRIHRLICTYMCIHMENGRHGQTDRRSTTTSSTSCPKQLTCFYLIKNTLANSEVQLLLQLRERDKL